MPVRGERPANRPSAARPDGHDFETGRPPRAARRRRPRAHRDSTRRTKRDSSPRRRATRPPKRPRSETPARRGACGRAPFAGGEPRLRERGETAHLPERRARRRRDVELHRFRPFARARIRHRTRRLDALPRARHLGVAVGKRRVGPAETERIRGLLRPPRRNSGSRHRCSPGIRPRGRYRENERPSAVSCRALGPGFGELAARIHATEQDIDRRMAAAASRQIHQQHGRRQARARASPSASRPAAPRRYAGWRRTRARSGRHGLWASP